MSPTQIKLLYNTDFFGWHRSALTCLRIADYNIIPLMYYRNKLKLMVQSPLKSGLICPAGYVRTTVTYGTKLYPRLYTMLWLMYWLSVWKCLSEDDVPYSGWGPVYRISRRAVCEYYIQTHYSSDSGKGCDFEDDDQSFVNSKRFTGSVASFVNC